MSVKGGFIIRILSGIIINFCREIRAEIFSYGPKIYPVLSSAIPAFLLQSPILLSTVCSVVSTGNYHRMGRNMGQSLISALKGEDEALLQDIA